MKRFYCTTCKRIRRARTLPSTVSNPFAETLTNRTGICSIHFNGSIAQAQRVKNPTKLTLVKTKQVAAPTVKKGKR